MARTAVMRPCLNKLDAPHAAILGKGLVSFHPLRFHAKCIGNKIFPTEFATQNIPVPTDLYYFLSKRLVAGAGFTDTPTLQKAI